MDNRPLVSLGSWFLGTPGHQNLQMLKSLHKMLSYLHIMYTHLPINVNLLSITYNASCIVNAMWIVVILFYLRDTNKKSTCSVQLCFFKKYLPYKVYCPSDLALWIWRTDCDYLNTLAYWFYHLNNFWVNFD